MTVVILKALVAVLLLNYIHATRLVCYLTNWSQYRNGPGQFFPKDIDPNLCTHLVYSFAQLTDNSLSTIEWDDLELYNQTIELKNFNPNLKVMIAVGGWNAASTAFSDMVTSDASRAQFVSQAVEFLKAYNFDGLDLDWEYPSITAGSRPTDKQQFSKLCSDLKAAFAPNNLLLSAAMAAGQSNIDIAYDIPTISKYVDFFNIMAYDYHGSWEIVTGANAPLYSSNSLSVSDTIDYYIQLGMPAEKINLGLGAYGHSWTLNSPSSNSMGSPANAPGLPGKYTGESGIFAYYEICQYLNQGWTRNFDAVQKVPYMYKGNQWASYDDVESLGYKVDFLKTKNLGGAMFWAIDQDDFNGDFCNNGKYPLISFVKSRLGNSNPNSATSAPPNTSTGSNLTTSETSQNANSTHLSSTKSSENASTIESKTATTEQITTTQKPTATTSSGTKLSCPPTGYFYPVKDTACLKFYECSNDIVYYFNCPTNTFFDVRINICNHISSFYCPV